MCILGYREFPTSCPADYCLDGLTVVVKQSGKVFRFDIEERSNPDGRHFVCACPDHPEAEPVDTLIHNNGQDHFCSCEISHNYGSCFHIESILQLMINGQMDDVMDSRQLSPWDDVEGVCPFEYVAGSCQPVLF